MEHPHLTVITSISLDHTEILGDTIGKIAREKAGIIKEGVPVICDGQCEEALQVIKEVAREHHAPVFPLMAGMYEIFMNSDKVIDFSLDTGYYLYHDITVSSLAGYQAFNVSLAVMAAEEMCIRDRVKIIEALKKEGIEKEDLGREKFLERAWDWKKEYGGRIVSQLKKMGSSADWDRERFTMDEGCSKKIFKSVPFTKIRNSFTTVYLNISSTNTIIILSLIHI